MADDLLPEEQRALDRARAEEVRQLARLELEMNNPAVARLKREMEAMRRE